MHAIHVILFNESQIRDTKIDALLDDGVDVMSAIPHKKLPKSIIVLPDTDMEDMSKYFPDGFKFIKVDTDYFGGFGEQSAVMFEVSTTGTYKKTGYRKVKSFKSKHYPINEALVELGVVKNSGMDEFDTIDLGKYRSNEDFLK